MNSDLVQSHLAALAERHENDLAAISAAAGAARDAIETGATELIGRASGRMQLLDVPVDDLPAYIPPPLPASEHALIPDTPLVDTALSNSSLAFDDAPLWQS